MGSGGAPSTTISTGAQDGTAKRAVLPQTAVGAARSLSVVVPGVRVCSWSRPAYAGPEVPASCWLSCRAGPTESMVGNTVRRWVTRLADPRRAASTSWATGSSRPAKSCGIEESIACQRYAADRQRTPHMDDSDGAGPVSVG